MKITIYVAILLLFWTGIRCTRQEAANAKSTVAQPVTADTVKAEPAKPLLDTAHYDTLIRQLANGDTTGKWPVKAPRPLPGAVLPFNRVVAYYGNLYSKRMGILGELPKAQLLQKLKGEVAKWEAADSLTPVIPALHYIAVTAQSRPGKGNKYRLRMPFHQIDTILNWSKEIDALTFLDIQVGHSNIRTEVHELEPYLKMPTVHLGIDPEFSMKTGARPGAKIGTYDASDINDVIDTLAKIVQENNIPPKILVIHRFTQGMITNYKNIKKVPEVQIVIDMDGFGSRILKESTWLRYIYREPVQFTGFKIFYYNDSKGNHKIYTPEELLKFRPKPIYIQYQ
ncbi:MAG: hypothetical protein ACK4TA_04495 [Saprospiraceae bacterium]